MICQENSLHIRCEHGKLNINEKGFYYLENMIVREVILYDRCT